MNYEVGISAYISSLSHHPIPIIVPSVSIITLDRSDPMTVLLLSKVESYPALVIIVKKLALTRSVDVQFSAFLNYRDILSVAGLKVFVIDFLESFWMTLFFLFFFVYSSESECDKDSC